MSVCRRKSLLKKRETHQTKLLNKFRTSPTFYFISNARVAHFAKNGDCVTFHYKMPVCLFMLHLQHAKCM